MGSFFKGVGRALGFGGNPNAGRRGAEQQTGFNQQAIDEIRRQFGITQENLDPFIQAGQQALPGVTEGSTVEGLDARIGRILNTDVFGKALGAGQESLRNQFAATGQNRSGTAAKAFGELPINLALQIENLLSGRGSNLVAGGQNAATGLGTFGAGASGGIADLFSRSGQAQSSGIITDAQGRAQQDQNRLNLVASLGSQFNFGGSGGGNFSPSDRQLKENIEPIGKIKDLTLYQWDWAEETKGTIIEKAPDIGFIADEVESLYPHHVAKLAGFKVIDYFSLLDELEAA